MYISQCVKFLKDPFTQKHFMPNVSILFSKVYIVGGGEKKGVIKEIVNVAKNIYKRQETKGNVLNCDGRLSSCIKCYTYNTLLPLFNVGNPHINSYIFCWLIPFISSFDAYKFSFSTQQSYHCFTMACP